MFGFLKPEKAQFATKSDLQLAFDVLDEKILLISQRVHDSNSRVAVEENRERRQELNAPIDPALIGPLLEKIPEQYKGIAEMVLRSGAVTPKMIKDLMGRII